MAKVRRTWEWSEELARRLRALAAPAGDGFSSQYLDGGSQP